MGCYDCELAAQHERDRLHWDRVDRETRERQEAAKARAAAKEQYAMAGCDGPSSSRRARAWDRVHRLQARARRLWCAYCGVELRDDDSCGGFEIWHAMGGMKRAPGPSGRDPPRDEKAAR